jgi:hypothetical protein
MKRGKRRAPERLVLRRARASDRDAILAMASRIWGGTDYLPAVWDKWLSDRDGVLLTATLGGRPVGMSKVTLLSPGEVWLEGLRLDPVLQGRGLSRQINRGTFRAAMSLKPVTVRYATGLSNAASRHLAEVRGFWLAAHGRYLVAPAAPARGLLSRAATAKDLAAVTRFIEASECYRLMGGLYGVSWTFPALDRRRIRRLVSEGRVLVIPRAGRPRAVAVWDRGRIDGEVCLGYADGSDADLRRFARDVRGIAARLGEVELSAMLPPGRIADTVHAAGFQADPPGNAIVYELGGRGFGRGDEPIEEVLGRTLLRHSRDAADLLAGFLVERAGRPVLRENALDFVFRRCVPDARRELFQGVERMSDLFTVHWMRNALRAVLDHLIERCGTDGSALSVRGGTAIVRYRGRPFLRMSVHGPRLRLRVLPDGPAVVVTDTRDLARAKRAIDVAARAAERRPSASAARRPSGRRWSV